MSLFEFGDLKVEIDYTDAEFLEDLEEAKALLIEEAKEVPKTGQSADIIRAQCQCFFNFFDRTFGEGAHEAMFGSKVSLNLCLDAEDALLAFDEAENEKINSRVNKYAVQQHGNRQQKRHYNKQNGKNKNYNREKR